MENYIVEIDKFRYYLNRLHELKEDYCRENKPWATIGNIIYNHSIKQQRKYDAIND